MAEKNELMTNLVFTSSLFTFSSSIASKENSCFSTYAVKSTYKMMKSCKLFLNILISHSRETTEYLKL